MKKFGFPILNFIRKRINMTTREGLVEEFCKEIQTKTNCPLVIKKYDSGSFIIYFREETNNNYHGDLLDHFNIFISTNSNQTPLTEYFDDIEKFAKDYIDYQTYARDINSVYIEDFRKKSVRKKLLQLITLIIKHYESYQNSIQYNIYKKLKDKYVLHMGDDWRSRVGGFDGATFYRIVAKNCIYNLNRKDYPLDFKEYEVHHKNGNKNDDDVRNLTLVTKEQHQEIHGRTW